MTGPCCARREAVADMYADIVAALEMALDGARADARSYQEVAYAAVEALSAATAEYDEVYARYVQLLDEVRALHGRAA